MSRMPSRVIAAVRFQVCNVSALLYGLYLDRNIRPMYRILALALFIIGLSSLPARGEGDYGVIYSSLKDDKVYNSLVVTAIQEFEANSKIRFRQRVINTPEDSVVAVRAFVERGITTLVLVGFIHEQAVRQLAPLYPHARFTVIDSDVTGPNVRAIRFREQEAGFLAGMAAAHATHTGQVAFIGGMAIPPVQRFGCGFLQGVREAGRPVQVTFRYLSTDMEGFRDRRLAKTIAEELTAGGVDVVFPAAGVASRDALLATAMAGAMGIGVDSDQGDIAPGRIVTSAVKRIDVAVANALKELVDGSWTPGNHELGVADGGVDWVRDGVDRFLTAEQIRSVEMARERIRNGSLRVTPDSTGCDQPSVEFNPKR